VSTFEDTIAALLEAKLTPMKQELVRVNQALETMQRMLPPQLLTVAQAAAALKISTSTVRRRMKDGSLPCRRISKNVVRVDMSALNGPSENEVMRIREELRRVG
jgi:excisionase family DNA binding protein